MDEISWRVELSVKPGQLENFKALTGMMVEMSKDEPGTLSYQRFVTDDGRSVHLYERYIDSVAALMHLHVFTKHLSLQGRGRECEGLTNKRAACSAM